MDIEEHVAAGSGFDGNLQASAGPQSHTGEIR